MNSALFFRLINEENKDARLLAALSAIRAGSRPTAIVHLADSGSLALVPGSPFSYWVNDRIRRLFLSFQRFEGDGRTAKIGASTKDDFRWLRAWWEVAPIRLLDGYNGPWQRGDDYQLWCRQRTQEGKRWAGFAKGGEWAPFYAPIPLVIDWADDGAEIKKTVSEYRAQRGWSPHWKAELHNPGFYFRPGLTWPRRTNGLSFRTLPAGCIFADKGPAVFVTGDHQNDLLALAGIVNSSAFLMLIQLMVGRVSLAQSFEVGLVQSVPVPHPPLEEARKLAACASTYSSIRREIDRASETSRVYHLPALLQCDGFTLTAKVANWGEALLRAQLEFSKNQEEIDEIAFRLYSITSADRFAFIPALAEEPPAASGNDESEVEADEGNDETTSYSDRQQLVAEIVSYAIGCAVGRWDVRIALDASLAPKLQGPFDPLPICSPGMLVGPDGTPAAQSQIASEAWLRARPTVISLPPEGSVIAPIAADDSYPLRIDWDAVLVDDHGHDDDIVGRVRDVFALLWGDRAEAIEQEASTILGVRGLRDYFRNPKGFWDFHVKRYSKSRRKAPIYWLLQSSKRIYGLWLYYPRLEADTLFKALGYVGNRLLLEQSRLDEALGQQRAIGEGDARTRRELDKRIEAHEDFISDVSAFRIELQRVADLGLTVDHDDGVLLSIAPLHNLVPWPAAKTAWNDLVAGKYGWSSIGKQLRSKGLIRETVRG